MLILSHLPIDHPATPAMRSGEWLGAIAHGSATAAAAGGALIDIGAPLMARRDGFIETWRTLAKPIGGQSAALRYRHDEQVLFGSIVLSEADFAADASGTALQKATDAAYRQIFELLDRLRFRHLWRVWNFIPRINAETGGVERYRQFNSGRSTAFLHSGRAAEGNVPAASAVGSNTAFTIYFLAGHQEPIAIENPRQISAYRYPPEYGPRSPVFSRAGLIELDDGEILFISGTASIVGHRTLHTGNVAAQTAEMLLNMDAVLDASNAIATRRKLTRGDLAYRVYLRRAEDLLCVQSALKSWLGTSDRVVYLQADICRADLLVEIEASGGHATDWSC